jgi:uncharacterized protein (TIGR02996 family)
MGVNRWDAMLINPTPAELSRADRSACASVNGMHYWNRVLDLDASACKHILSAPSSWLQRGGIREFENPYQFGPISIAGVAWFVDRSGRRHVRVFVERTASNSEISRSQMHNRWFGAPSMDSPSPLECVYPLLYYRGKPGWQSRIYESAFVGSILKDPANTFCRAIFADWLDDEGRLSEAKWQRVVVDWLNIHSLSSVRHTADAL